jgi:predicted metal-dependent hydrolase
MAEVPPEPVLDPAELTEFRKGVEEFNAGKFFECHDTLEEVWRGIRGPARDFFQGLIQISVGFYHLSNGNLRGAESQLERALVNLHAYGERYLGVELADLRCEVGVWLERIRSGEKLGGTVADLPKYRLTPPG